MLVSGKQQSDSVVHTCVCVFVCVLVLQSRMTLYNLMDCGLPGSSCPWNSLGKNTGMGCHFLLQGIFLMQGSNLGLLRCRQTLSIWATREVPYTHTHTHTHIYKAIYILRLFSLIDYYKILHTVPCFIQYIGCLFVTGQSWARAGHLREQSHLSLSILETKLTPSFCVILTSKEKCFELKSNRRNHPSTQSVSLILSCWRLQIPD